MTLDLLERNRQDMLRLSQQSRELSAQYIKSVLMFSIIGIIAGISIGIWLTHIIVKPIEELTTAVSEIRKGNLDTSVNTNHPDEMGILAVEFNKMTERIKTYQQLNLEKLIEEKKRTEAILRSVGDGMIVIDPSYKIIMVNPTAERIFYLIPGISHGRDFRDVIKSEALFNIIQGYIDKRTSAKYQKMLPTFVWEYGREKKHYQVRVFPVEREDSSRIAYVVLLEDVTKLKELDQLKSDFISIASHELRTPMTSIIMSLDLVSSGAAGPLNEDQLELLKAADEDARRMRILMTNLLDISRIETGRMEMDMLSVSPAKIIQDTYSSFNLPAESQKVQVIEKIDEKLPDVKADYNRILQVMTNLMGNALRYSPEGGKITLRTKCAGNFVQFSVCDTGPGIPKEYLKKIFLKFVQVDGDPKRGGAGLGLALSYEIVKAHGGQIWAESELGEGSCFNFTLPILKTEKEKRDTNEIKEAKKELEAKKSRETGAKQEEEKKSGAVGEKTVKDEDRNGTDKPRESRSSSEKDSISGEDISKEPKAETKKEKEVKNTKETASETRKDHEVKTIRENEVKIVREPHLEKFEKQQD
jgi:two-component system, NtrC family, sensor histidine kinase KinB